MSMRELATEVGVGGLLYWVDHDATRDCVYMVCENSSRQIELSLVSGPAGAMQKMHPLPDGGRALWRAHPRDDWLEKELGL